MTDRIVPGNPKPLTNADLLAALVPYATIAYVGATFAPISHSHGNITNDGRIGSTANLPLITTTGGSVTVGSFGTSANTFCQGNDSRLSDARTPLAHTQAWSTITSTPTTLSGYGITDAQPLDSDLTAIAALSTTSHGRSLLTGADAAATRSTIAAAGTGVSNTFTQSQTIANAIFLSGNNPTFGPATSDGSDNQIFFVLGGGGFGPTTRGPHFAMHGLDAATRPGNIELHAGLNAEVRLGGEQGGGHVIGLTVRPNGMCRFRTGTWHGDDGGNQREFYSANSTSFHKGLGTTPHEWYNGSDATVLRLGSGGELTLFGLRFDRSYTVATLPSAAANAGASAQVTDANATTFYSTVAGGGSNRVQVFSNGTNWVIV